MTNDSGIFIVRNRYPLPDRRYAIHLEFDFDNPINDKQALYLAWGLTEKNVGWSINFYPKSILLQAPNTSESDVNKTIDMPLASKNTLDVNCDGDVAQVTLNEKPLAMDFGNKDVLGKLKPVNWVTFSTNAAVHVRKSRAWKPRAERVSV